MNSDIKFEHTDTRRAFMNPDEAAGFLGVSARQVRNLCAKGSLKAVKVGKLWRVNRAALLALADPGLVA